MKTVRFNGEWWYEDRRSLLTRARQWVIRIGGWERPDRTDGAYRTRWAFRANWGWRGWRDPFPVSLLGHRVTFQSFGVSIRLGGRYLCWSYRREPGRMYGPLGTGYCYLSRNGTPWAADHWLWGADKWHGWPEIRRNLRGNTP